MRDINRIMLFGTSHEEPKYLVGKTGTKICKFKMYTLHSGNSGKKGEIQGTFFNVVCFGKTAEYLEKMRFAHKSRVLVEGRFEKQKYTNKNGDIRYYEQVVASAVSPILPRKEKPAPEETYDAPEGVISFDDDKEQNSSEDSSESDVPW